MSKKDKLLAKLRAAKGTFPWSDLVTLLGQLGFDREEKAGSRVRFFNPETQRILRIHKPHPQTTSRKHHQGWSTESGARNIKAGGLLMTYLKYKGYLGTIEPDLESGTLFGKVAFIRDLVTYEANDLKALEQEFRESVNGYLEDCTELAKEPDKPLKGSFNVRIGADLHRAAVIAAGSSSLNTFVTEAIKEKLDHQHHHAA